jgi:hypothetical protein
MKIDVHVLPEPKLEFGSGTIGENPKTALPASGPFLPAPDGSARRISLGLVAPVAEISHILAWFDRMETLIVSDETNAQRYPAFPGVERVLRCRFLIEDRCIVRLDEPRLRIALASSGNRLFHELLDLYQDAISSLFVDSGPDCILVQFSEEIANLRIVNPSLSQKERRALERLREEEQAEQLSLFEPTPEEMKVARTRSSIRGTPDAKFSPRAKSAMYDAAQSRATAGYPKANIYPVRGQTERLNPGVEPHYWASL